VGGRGLSRAGSADAVGVSCSAIDPLAATIRRLRCDLEVDRLSLAYVDGARATFRIVAWDGKGIFASGTELPLATSTQVGAAARGSAYASADFEREPDWTEPTDRLMLALGFRSGCALPVRGGDGAVAGVASLSATSAGIEYGGRLDQLERSAPALAAELERLDRPGAAELTQRERDVLVLLDAGLRFKHVARELGIAEPTAKGYAQSLFRKLGAGSRAEAVFEARRRGLL
jgi:DNA-binding CsgD family transcriptional regulator